MRKYLVFVFVAVIVGLFVFSSSRSSPEAEPQELATPQQTEDVVREPCVPTARDVQGPYYQQGSPLRERLAPPEVTEGILVIGGRVYESDCTTPVVGAIIDIWQADEQGNYRNDWYRGKVETDRNGEYRFGSVLPGSYQEGRTQRAPHIHYSVFRGDTKALTSQIYFEDRLLFSVDETRLVSLQETVGGLVGNFDIVLP